MKKISLIFVMFFADSLGWSATPYIPKSKSEPIQFLSAKEIPLGTMGKISDYLGVIVREKTIHPVSKTIDVYEFKKTKDIQVSEKMCGDLVQKVFGPSDKIALKIKEKNLIPSKRSGKMCVYKLVDSSPTEIIKERHFIVRISDLRVLAFEFRFPQTATEGQSSDAIQFVESIN